VGALEGGSPPPVQPLAGGDDQLGERRLGIEVLDALQVVVREDGEIDLVEDLSVGRAGGLAVLAVAGMVFVG
jgi:hypothetical protein